MNTNYKESLFEKMPVVGILRNVSLEIMAKFLPYYKKAGFTTLEITMNSDNVTEAIQYLTKNHPDLNIGAGTVCNMGDLRKALDIGASFIVTPIIDEEVIHFCRENDIPIFPGAFTPSEIYKADKLGAAAVKVFPATQLGTGYIKDVLAPLDHLKLLPTGGVSVDNIEDYFKAGAIGVGMGGSLFDKKLIAANDYDGLFRHFQVIANKVSKFI